MAAQDTLQVFRQHRAGADGIDAGFGMRCIKACGDVASGKYFGMRCALLPVSDCDKTITAQSQPRFGKPGGRSHAGCRDDAIDSDFPTIRYLQSARGAGGIAVNADDTVTVQRISGTGDDG